jgi:hypothetical protein
MSMQTQTQSKGKNRNERRRAGTGTKNKEDIVESRHRSFLGYQALGSRSTKECGRPG